MSLSFSLEKNYSLLPLNDSFVPNELGSPSRCYIRVSTHIAGLAAKPNDVLDTLDLTNFGVKTLLVYWILFRYN